MYGEKKMPSREEIRAMAKQIKECDVTMYTVGMVEGLRVGVHLARMMEENEKYGKQEKKA